MKGKKITVILLTACLLLCASACNEADISSNTLNLASNVSFTAGKIGHVGDVFSLPKIETTTSAGSPVLAEVTNQANPGDHLTVIGEGFSAKNCKAYIYAQSTSDNGNAYESEYEYVGDNQIVVKIADDIPYGIYAVYVVTENGTSNVKFVNAPEIWWNSFTSVKCGESVTVYGVNLTRDNGENETNVWLVGDNKYCEVEVTYADPYKVTFNVPQGLETDSQYGITLHNGHGGDYGFAESPEKIKIVETRANDFHGNVINVVDYGADPKDAENDDSNAIRSAINSASDGDTIYFPNGTYVVDSPIAVNNKSLKITGESFENTVIVAGTNISSSATVITIKTGPSEICNLSFVNIRDTGTLPPMIAFSADGNDTGSWILNVHNCRYTARGSKYAMSGSRFVNVNNSEGILLENNDVASPGMYTVYAKNVKGISEKVFIRNNRYYGQNYAGAYYDGMNCMSINGVDKADISNNYFASADILVDDTNIIDDGDLMNGRSMSIQGIARRFYIAKNEIVASDIPGECAGEQIMSEGNRACYHEIASSATDDTVTLPSYSNSKFANLYYNQIPAKGSRIYVSNGKGYGQNRIIKQISENVITVDKPWDIVPDTTSVICVTTGHYDFVIYKNNISGSANHSKTGGGGCGVMIYNDVYNFRVIDNTISDVNTGIYLEQHGVDLTDDPYSNKWNSSNWCIISGNNISKTNVGIRSMMCNAFNNWNDGTPFRVQTGVSIRRNIFSNIVDWTRDSLVGVGGVGIMYSRTTGDYNTVVSSAFDTWKASWQYGTVIESNQFKNCARANVLLGMYQGSTVLLNNTAFGSVLNIYTLDNQYSAYPLICK